MKYNNIIKSVLFAVLSVGVAAGCAREAFDEVTEMDLARCLEPQNLNVRVSPVTGDDVTFLWDVNKDADSYNLVVYSDEAMTKEVLNTIIPTAEVPYTVKMKADQKYWFKVQALSDKRDGSHWATFGDSFKTYAVKDNLYLEAVNRTDSSISLTWDTSVSDYKDVTHIDFVPVAGGDTVTYTLTDSDISSGAATVPGLSASTEYQVTLFYMSASRGSVDVWTRAAQGSATRVSTSEALAALMAAGDEIYLTLEGSPYSIGSVKPAGSVRLLGEIGPDGTMPVVTTKIELTDALPENASIYAEGILFDGGGAQSRIVEHTGGALNLASVKFVNCEITNYAAGFFYDNIDALIKLGELTFDSCNIHDILGTGGDAVDIRKATEIGSIKFVNNTIANGIRTFFRIDASDAIKIQSITFDNNTVKNIATVNDGNNRGVFAIRVATEMSLKKNLFLYEDGGNAATPDKAQLFQENNNTVVPSLSVSDNYSFAQGSAFFSKVSAAEAGFKILADDPCYNSKGNFFQLENQDLVSKKVGASQWWIAFVEKEEDLTQNVVPAPHTWNLQNATLFAGDVKKAKVRDEILFTASETTPMNADGGINFLSASPLTKRGVPTDGYISFKVASAGSVDMEVSDPEGKGSSVVVALIDDNGFSVKGGAVASASTPGVQKVVVSPVAGEGTVILYSTGPISIVKLAWSEDTIGGNKVLASPKPVVEPVTLTEGDETAVTVTWNAIPNAASYVVTFNKRVADPQTELSYTVDAETIAGLDAGLYNFTVQALPADTDIYYTKSEIGTAAVAIQPKGGEEGEVVTVNYTWDFSDADWQAELASKGAKNADITNWVSELNGLTFTSTAKSKWNTATINDVVYYYIQAGGKGNNADGTLDRTFTFTTPVKGIVKITASNTGGSAATDARRVAVLGSDGTTQYGDTPAPPSNAPIVYEFEVPAGLVTIYPDTNGLRFYKIEFSGEGAVTPVKEDFVWDFSDADWQAELAAKGAKNADITNWVSELNGLTFTSTAKSKWNTATINEVVYYFIQAGGKGNNSDGTLDRTFTFTTTTSGTVSITASNTGGSAATDARRVAVLGSDGVTQYGDTPAPPSTEPKTYEFEVPAGLVTIYPDTNGLRFYKIEYHSK